MFPPVEPPVEIFEIHFLMHKPCGTLPSAECREQMLWRKGTQNTAPCLKNVTGGWQPEKALGWANRELPPTDRTLFEQPPTSRMYKYIWIYTACKYIWRTDSRLDILISIQPLFSGSLSGRIECQFIPVPLYNLCAMFFACERNRYGSCVWCTYVWT